MAQRSSSSRGATATTARKRPDSARRISESDIGQLKVDEIRGRLRKRGVTGTSALRKPELVKALAKSMRADRGGGGAAGRKSTRPASRSTAPARKTTAPARKSTASARKSTASARKTTVSARKTTASARKSAAPAKKTTASARKSSAPAKRTASAGRGGGATSGRGSSSGKGSSRSLKYAQRISSPDERPERLGRSLVTQEHEVIQRWARDRGADPATIEGTEKGTRPGVLTFNFPGYREGGRLRTISWDQWFKSFDGRRLNFIYQEQMTSGRQSNFFRVESPDREDA